MFEMSQILNCGIDQRTLSILASLIENGVNPEALAAVVKELKRESDALKVSYRQSINLCLGGISAVSDSISATILQNSSHL